MDWKSLANFYNGKRVLITGHTGFKGSWLSIWLHSLGADVTGYALDPLTPKDNYELSTIGRKIKDIRGDIRDIEKLNTVFSTYQPEIVFHLAAQPLVKTSYENPVETYEINVMGSIHLMEAIRKCPSTKVAIMITTDKCYENKEQVWGYRENEPMGGYDPYSSSKGAAEIAIASWRRSFMNPQEYAQHGKSIASARAGNVIGGGDWGNHRIVPDCIRALEGNVPVKIRNSQAIRPWQHVLEPLSGYLLLVQKIWNEPVKYCEGWNFGPKTESVCTVQEITAKIISCFGYGIIENQPDNTFHEAELLLLDISKAKFQLGWTPQMDINKTIELTVDWYARYKQEDIYTVCLEHIKEFTQ